MKERPGAYISVDIDIGRLSFLLGPYSPTDHNNRTCLIPRHTFLGFTTVLGTRMEREVQQLVEMVFARFAFTLRRY